MTTPRPLSQQRSYTPMSTTNPFRQSMLLRSESPLDDLTPPTGPTSNPYGVYGEQRRGSAPSLRGQPISPALETQDAFRRPSTPSSNPFQVELDSEVTHDLPPSYSDITRRHSDSSSAASEKDRIRRREDRDRRERDLRERERDYRERETRDREYRDRDREYRTRDRVRSDPEREAERPRESRRKPDGYYGESERRKHREHRSDRGERSDRSDRAERSERSERSEKERRERRAEKERHYERGERSARDRSDREREKHRESSSRRHRSKSESVVRRGKDGLPLDVIDKMDVTGLFGPGSFHHDGPFDACTPHRNKVNAKAPVAAFLAEGPNNSLTVVDPAVGRYNQVSHVFGLDPESEIPTDLVQSNEDVSKGVTEFDTRQKATPIHGHTTLGLGSSTFMDGTPASRDAIDAASKDQSEGLSRSKSLLRRASSGRRPNPRPRPEPQRVQSDSSQISTNSPTVRIASNDPPVEAREKPTGLLGRVKSLRVRR